MQTIPTGFYSPKALKVLLALRHLQSLDNNKHARTFIRRSMSCSRWEQDVSGEIVLACDKLVSWSDGQAFGGMSPAEIFLKLAQFYKQRIMEILKKNGKSDWWNRYNAATLTLLMDKEGHTIEVQIKDLYYIYDCLMGRKPPASRYSTEYLDEIRGKARDPITTEMISSLREEIEQAKNKAADQKRDLESESWKKANEAAEIVRKQYREKIVALETATAQHIKELESSIAAAIEMAAV